MKQIIEEWRDIKGYEGLYKISNLGNVKSMPRVCVRNNGRTYTNSKEYILCQNLKHGWYYQVKLSNAGRYKTKLVHRLIAEAFIPNPFNKPDINHINCIKNDNRIENLEWCTHTENMRHSAKLNKKIVEEILLLNKSSNISRLDLSKMFCVSRNTIRRVITKESWY